MTSKERPHWPDFSALEAKIDYAFRDRALLVEALCHSSYTKHPDGVSVSNERLEFLGDRVVNLCIADMIYHQMDNQPEGRLSKRVSSLVRKETLAEVARKIGLGEFLLLGKGERQHGGADKDNILADAMEALLAAIYLDNGGTIIEAKKVITAFWADDILKASFVDAKSRLQEWLQKQGEPLPEYELSEILGDAHDATFRVLVKTANHGEALGEGKSKQQAQQSAAQALLVAKGVLSI